MPQGRLSRKWLDLDDPLNLTTRGHLRAMGFTDYDMGRPIIGVCNPWSELNPGHWHFKTLAEAVKRGIWAAGGFPLEFPTISHVRGVPQHLHPDLSQPDGAGHRGVHGLHALRRRGAALHLRQGRAGPAHGLRHGQQAGHHHHRRHAPGRLLRGPHGRLLHRHAAL